MKKVPTFAANVLMMFLVGALASAQTVAGQPNRDTQNLTTQNETPQHADESGKNDSKTKKQNKKQVKAKSKGAPSQEEKDFDRVLLGIFG